MLSAIFVSAVSLAGDPAFAWNLVVLGPIFALAGAGSAAGSLAWPERRRARGLPTVDEDTADTGLCPRVRPRSCSEAVADLSTRIAARPVVSAVGQETSPRKDGRTTSRSTSVAWIRARGSARMSTRIRAAS